MTTLYDSIYETVKTVNGYKIQRMKGSRGCYHVHVSIECYYSFKTIKDASAFCEKISNQHNYKKERTT